MNKKRRILGGLLAACLSAVAVACFHQAAIEPQPSSILISVAASLKEVMEEVKPLYQQTQPKTTLNFNFGASGALLQQIEQGAPVDVFVSASKKQVDTLEQAGKLLAGTRTTLATNRLVLIAPRSATEVTGFDSLTRSNVRRIAIGEPRSVPAGQYAEQVLQKLKIYNQIQPKLVLANNVRQVLSVVESGNADAGLVYVTDAKLSDKIKVVATANPNDHAAIVYPIAVLQRSKNAQAAREFVQFLLSRQARAILQKYGFGLP